MPQALLATYRLRTEYTIGGLTHKTVQYVKGVSGSPGSIILTDRTSATHTLQQAADAWAQNLDAILDNTLTSVNVFLDQLVAGIWQLVDTVTVSLAGSSGTAYKPATQLTYVFRDSSFFKMKVVLIEASQSAPAHWTSPTGGGSSNNTLVKEYTSGHVSTHAVWLWGVSRGNRYLADSPFVGGTCTLNRKIRRARGLA